MTKQTGNPIVPDAVLAPNSKALAVHQDDHAKRVVSLHTMAGQCASMAVYCAAAAGAVMLCKKKTLKHGAFRPWASSITLADGRPLAYATATRYMSLATEMVARIKAMPKSSRMSFLGDGAASDLETLAAFDPSNMGDLRNQAVAQLVAKATNERGITQLYFDWGIMKEPGKLGGIYHPRKILTDAEALEKETAACRATWTRLGQDLKMWGLDEKSWLALSRAEVDALISITDELLKQMRKFQRERKS